MFVPSPVSAFRPSPGFWVREGIGSGLTLAGFAPSRPDELELPEVRADNRCGPGRLLRFVFPADIADAP